MFDVLLDDGRRCSFDRGDQIAVGPPSGQMRFQSGKPFSQSVELTALKISAHDGPIIGEKKAKVNPPIVIVRNCDELAIASGKERGNLGEVVSVSGRDFLGWNKRREFLSVLGRVTNSLSQAELRIHLTEKRNLIWHDLQSDDFGQHIWQPVIELNHCLAAFCNPSHKHGSSIFWCSDCMVLAGINDVVV